MIKLININDKSILVVGAAAIGDYIFEVEHLPDKGEIVEITNSDYKLTPGGCAPNIACGIASLGVVNPILCYPVGSDFKETKMEEYWKSLGLECHLTYNMSYPSGKSWMYMQKDGTTMCFAYPGSASMTIPDEMKICSEWVIITPVLNGFTRAYLEMAINQNKHIVVTGIGSVDLKGYLEKIDILILNQYETKCLCKHLCIENELMLSQRYTKLKLYVTYGGNGSNLYLGGEITNIPVVKPVKIFDFTGAGDAYTSGTISALIKGYDCKTAAYFGAANSSYVLENWGGQENMPSWDKLLQRIKEQYPLIKI